MDPHKIISYLKLLNLKVSIVNSNLNYSILLHTLDKIKQKLITKNDIEKISYLFEYFVDLDINRILAKKYRQKYKSLEEKFADQYFLIAKD